MKVITVSTQKGGTGKTATALALSAGLAKKGFRVLLIDSDPQCNATFASGVDPAADHLTLFNLYERTATAIEASVETESGYSLVPGSLMLTTADLKDSGSLNRENRLKGALKGAEKHFDYVVCDTPPQIGLLVENVLLVTDSIIIPATADAFSIQGLMQYADLLREIKSEFEGAVKFSISGILITRYSDRTNISKSLKDLIYQMADKLETKVFDTQIREAVAIRESFLARKDIFAEHPKADVTKDYEAFIEEFLKG